MIPNEESQQSCLWRSCMKSSGSKALTRSCFSLGKSWILMLLCQQTASWFPVPPLRRTKHSNGNTKGPLFCYSKVPPWYRPSWNSLGVCYTNKMLQDSCMGELICFEFPISCQHRIAQDGDKGEETKGLTILKLLQGVFDSRTFFCWPHISALVPF